MKIEKFDRTSLKALRTKLEAVLADAGIEGVTFKIGNMRFDETKVDIKLTAETEGQAEVKTELVEEMAKLHGLASTSKDGYTLVDFHHTKPKYPFIATKPNGGRIKMTPDQARLRFGAVERAVA